MACEGSCEWIYSGGAWVLVSSTCTAECAACQTPTVPGVENDVLVEFCTYPCGGNCWYTWSDASQTWTMTLNNCTDPSTPGCGCGPEPGYAGLYDGQAVSVNCEDSALTTTTTTTTTTVSPACDYTCAYYWNGSTWVNWSPCPEGCYCSGPPDRDGEYMWEDASGTCQDTPPTTTTTTTTTTTSSTTSSSTTSSTTTSSTSSTTTSSTSTTTTTTTTTAAPCTGGCTWQWSAAGQTWLKYGPGNCSEGCSCQAPTEAGTEDGEYQTAACGKLTCKNCCNRVNCCRTDIPVECCGEGFTIPSHLTLTIQSETNWPCIDGMTITLSHRETYSFDYWVSEGDYEIFTPNLYNNYQDTVGASKSDCGPLKYSTRNTDLDPSPDECVNDFPPGCDDSLYLGAILKLYPCSRAILYIVVASYNGQYVYGEPYCAPSLQYFFMNVVRDIDDEDQQVCSDPFFFQPYTCIIPDYPGDYQGLCEVPECFLINAYYFLDIGAGGPGETTFTITE